jgi:PHD/YefM family antitoxin component YafN of YafNO toxin-antitoxin module
MNPLLRLFAVGSVLLTAVSSFAAGGFEGKVTQLMTPEKGKAHEINYSIKGSKVRLDINNEGHQAAIITDLEKLETLMIMDEQKMYMVMPIKKPVEQALEKSGDSSVDVKVTGKTETILGYKCNQVLITDKSSGAVTEVWMAEGLGVFMGLGSGGGGGGPFGGRKAAAAAKWEEALKGKAGYPLRISSNGNNGKGAFKMETTKIEPGSLPDSLFAPPAGYKKFQMPDMGSLMKGFGG